MRVVHIGHVPLPQGVDMGVKASRNAYHPGRWVLNLAQAQAAHTDIRPEIVIKVPGTTRQVTTELEGIPAHFVGVPNILRGKTGFFLDQRILARVAMKLQPDVVHAHGTEEANALAALRCPVPQVLTLQGCFFMINKRLPARFFSRQWIVERLERRSIPRFRLVITKSEYIRREIESEFPGVFTSLIPNTYPVYLESLEFDATKSDHAAFVGSFSERKGVHIIVEAIQKIKGSGKLPRDFHLHIFGNSVEHAGSYEKDMIVRLRSLLEDRLVLHGLVPNEELGQHLVGIKVLLAPSLEEMFGNQVIEALMAGMRVIVTEDTAMAENVRRFGGGAVIPQGDCQVLANTLLDELQKPFDRKTASHVRDKIKDYMSPEAVANRHLQLYLDAIELLKRNTANPR